MASELELARWYEGFCPQCEHPLDASDGYLSACIDDVVGNDVEARHPTAWCARCGLWYSLHRPDDGGDHVHRSDGHVDRMHAPHLVESAIRRRPQHITYYPKVNIVGRD